MTNPMNIRTVQKQLAEGRFTAVELVTALVERIKHSSNNGFTRVDARRAMEQAEASDERRRQGVLLGPLDGVPLAHKDMFQRAGHTAGCGTRPFAGEEASTLDAPLLSALDRAGAVDVGVVHMAELALSPFGINVHLGNGINPWDERYPSGGSSSGSAIAVARGLVAASLGSDTGGSLRLPAAACGMSAFKPTNGLLSLEGVFQLSATLDTAGVIGGTTDDCLDVFEILAPSSGRDVVPASSVVAIPDLDRAKGIPAPVLDNLRATVSALTQTGIATITVPVPDLRQENWLATIILAFEANDRLGKRITERPESVGEQVRRRILQGQNITSDQYETAMAQRDSATTQFLERYLGAADVLLLPTLGFALPRLDELPAAPGPADAAHFNQFSYWTRPINYFGLPAAQLPTGLAAGMPTGIQLIGRSGEDGKVLSIASRIQQRIPAWQTAAIPADTTDDL
jgi:aspartyl-tRNA(Asn)/glutamyl-tRNA(Gln) amidotransferase subunit A